MDRVRKSRVKMYGVRGGKTGCRVVLLGGRGAVPERAAAEVRWIARYFGKEIGYAHAVVLFVAPAPAVRSPDGGIGFGFFARPKCRKDRVAIAVAGTMPRYGLAEAVMHELVHYEQFKNRRELTERGVRSRATSLLRRARRR